MKTDAIMVTIRIRQDKCKWFLCLSTSEQGYKQLVEENRVRILTKNSNQKKKKSVFRKFSLPQVKVFLHCGQNLENEKVTVQNISYLLWTHLEIRQMFHCLLAFFDITTDHKGAFLNA